MLSKVEEKYTAWKDMPYGLERHILQIITNRVGKTNRIKKDYLIYIVKGIPGCQNIKDIDRKIRLAVNNLRDQGHLICSTNEDGGGYWIADCPEDVEEFIEREINSRIISLNRTKQAMKDRARAQWGEGVQIGLF